MKKVTLIPYISLAFFYHLAMPFFGTFFPALYFAPFFTTCYHRKSLFFSLWVSFFIGLFLDLCTSSTPLGFYPVCTILVTLLIHRFKVYFLEEKPFIFVIYTGIYSFTYSLVFTFLHTFFEPRFKIAILAFLLDTLFLPLLDMFYHLSFFTLPILGYYYLTSREQKARYLRLKKSVKLSMIKLQKAISR